MYGQHWLGSGKISSNQMADGYKYVRFTINYSKINTISTGMTDGAEQFGQILGRQRFNLFALIHQNANYVFFDSDDTAEYTARDYSKVTDESNKPATGVNIYDAETGALVLESMTENKNGSLLQVNKKYIMEFDVTGTDNGSVIFTGFRNARISNPVWSNKLYPESTAADEVADRIRLLNNDKANHRNESENPRFHRIWNSADGYTGDYGAICQLNAANEVDTTKCYETHHDWSYRCLEFARLHWYATNMTTKQANKKYFRMTVEYKEMELTEVGSVVRDKNDPEYGTLGGTFFNSFVYSPAGGRYLYVSAHYPA